MSLFGKGSIYERAGIPTLIWVGVLVLLLNHVVYPFLGTLCPWITPVPLPVQYWTALGWIICGLFGKKVGDKYVARGAAPEAQDGNGNQPQD